MNSAPVVNVSDFLRELVLVLPGTVHAHASILLPHLSSRPYQIRIAVVFALGEVVIAACEDRKAAAAAAAAASGGGSVGGGGSVASATGIRESEGGSQEV